jgi:hypothetical protein
MWLKTVYRSDDIPVTDFLANLKKQHSTSDGEWRTNGLKGHETDWKRKSSVHERTELFRVFGKTRN